MNHSNTSVILGFYAHPKTSLQATMLVRSLRQFGGGLANMPVWIFIREKTGFTPSQRNVLESLDVQFFHFHIDEDMYRLPFAAKAVAAAEAEKLAEVRNNILAWHDRTGLICHAPWAFQLPEDISFGFRPTDIANIGAPFGQPLPPFWETICDTFNLTAEQLPAITTVIDQVMLHLYINAGLLVVKPENKILNRWAENLRKSYALPEFKRFYQEDQRYAIFMHQAALTAAVVQQTSPEERVILPDDYLFSVDNFFDYPEEIRPQKLDDIVTGRFHEFFSLDDWEKMIHASPELIGWFWSELAAGPYWPI